MTADIPNDDITFSPDYVKELRTENASWRHKVRELEQKVQKYDIQVEFARRGIDADPSMLNIPEGMSAAEAVDKFVSTFQIQTPAAAPSQEAPRPNYPSALAPNTTKPNASGPPAQGAFGGRTLKEVEADPKAREQVRAMYREMLRSGSYGSRETIFDS